MKSGIVGLKKGKNFPEYRQLSEATSAEAELKTVMYQYNQWKLDNQEKDKIVAFIDNHLKRMNDDKTRADFMAYITSVPDIQALFTYVLLIDLTAYKAPAIQQAHANGHANGDADASETAALFIRAASDIPSKKHLSPQEARFKKFQEWMSSLDLDEREKFNSWLGATPLEPMSRLLKAEQHDKCPHKKQRAFLTWFDEELRALFDKYLALPVEHNGDNVLANRKSQEAANQKFRHELSVWIDGVYAQAVKAAKNALTKKTPVTYPALASYAPSIDNPLAPVIAVGAAVNAFATAPSDAYMTLETFLVSQEIRNLITAVNVKFAAMDKYFYRETLAAMSYNGPITLEDAYMQYTADSRLKTAQTLFANEESGLVLTVANSIAAADEQVEPVANPLVIGDIEGDSRNANFKNLLNDKNWFKLTIYLDKKAFDEKKPSITMLLNPDATDYQDRKAFLQGKGLELSKSTENGQTKLILRRAMNSSDFLAYNTTNEALSDLLTGDQLEFLENWLKNCPTAVKNYINQNSCNFYTTVCIGWFGYAGELLYLGADFMIRIEGIAILLKVFLGLSLNTSDEAFSNILNGVLTMFTATANLTFFPNADARNLMVKQAIHPNKSLFDLMIWKQVKERPWLALSFFCSSLAGALVDVLPLQLLKKYQSELGGQTGYQITFGGGSAVISASGVVYYTAYLYDGYNDATDAGMKYFKKAWADATSADPEKRAIGQPLLVQMLITGIERVIRMGFGPWVFGDSLNCGSTASLSLAAGGSVSTIGTLPVTRFRKLGKHYYDLSPEERQKGEERYPKWREEHFDQFLRAHILDHSSFFTAAIAYAISEMFTMAIGLSGPLRAVAITIGCVLIGKLVHSFFAPLIYLNILKELAKSDNVHVPGLFVQASVGVDQVSRSLGALSIGAALWSAGFTSDTPEGRLVIIVTYLIELGLSKANYLLQLDSTDEAVRGVVSEAAETGIYRWGKAVKDDVSLFAMSCRQNVSEAARFLLSGICSTAGSSPATGEAETEITTPYYPMRNDNL